MLILFLCYAHFYTPGTHVASAAFGTPGAATSTADANDEDAEVMKKVQERFSLNVQEMPATIDTTSYLNA